MPSYRLNQVAKEDLIRIHHYGIITFGEHKYFERFFEYYELISQRPYSFESVDHIKKGYRRCVCGVDSIYFKVNENIVEKMSIIGRQDNNKCQ